MEVKPGYKQTEVGVIPEDWKVVRFSDLLEFRNGVNADKHAYGKGIPFINVLEVISKTHLCRSDIPGRVFLARDLHKSYGVRHGDLLFNRTSETQEEVGLSSVYLDNDTVVFGGFVIRGRPKGDFLDATFSGYALRSPVIRSQIVAKGQGAIRANVGQADLRQVLAPLPTLPEQRAIAAALSDVDALIGALDQLIAKKRDLKQAATQQLLTGQTHLPGLSGEWCHVRLRDLLFYERPDRYIVQDTEYSERGDIPVLTANKSFILGYTVEDFGICRNLPAIVFDDFTTDSKYVDFPFKVKSSAIKLLRTKHDRVDLRFVFERMQLINFPLGGHKRYYWTVPSSWIVA